MMTVYLIVNSAHILWHGASTQTANTFWFISLSNAFPITQLCIRQQQRHVQNSNIGSEHFLTATAKLGMRIISNVLFSFIIGGIRQFRKN